MIECMKIILKNYNEFKGTGMYVALFLISLLYIFIKEDNKNIKSFFVYNSAILFIIVFNPIFNKIVGKIFTSPVYWRTFWVIPFGITIAYAGTKLIMDRQDKVERIVTIISVFTIIMVSGKFIYNKDNYQKVNNLYKLPDESVLVTQIIAESSSGYKKAIVPPTLVAHIRQIDSSIELAYKRHPSSYNNHPVLKELSSGNVPGVIRITKEKNCNYVVYEKATVLNDEMEKYDFEKLNETDNYIIYKRKN